MRDTSGTSWQLIRVKAVLGALGCLVVLAIGMNEFPTAHEYSAFSAKFLWHGALGLVLVGGSLYANLCILRWARERLDEIEERDRRLAAFRPPKL